MQTHDLVQGSDAWHAHRLQHWNASDAPAMMGCSPHKTRTQLLQELQSGITADVDPATQRRFDDGHRFEALARPLAEAILGEDLYPVTGSLGKLSASFDGLTMAEDTAFEHKTLNAELYGDGAPWPPGYVLPLNYRVQMEQQLMVSGAGRVLFMASRWRGEELSEEQHCWYTTDDKLREAIERGWEQFAIDLAGYQHVEVLPAATGTALQKLPALNVSIMGKVTASNLVLYKATATAFVAAINEDLQSDQDFADADTAVKFLGDAEKELDTVKKLALGQTADIDALFKTIDQLQETMRAKRLTLDKLVTARKTSIRAEIKAKYDKLAAEHMTALNKSLGRPYMPAIAVDFATCIKGKRLISAIEDACKGALATFKIAADDWFRKIQTNQASLRDLATDHYFLFTDVAALILKSNDDLVAVIQNRINEYDKAEQKKRDDAVAAALAKAEAEKAAVDKKAADDKAEADRKEQERKDAEAKRAQEAATPVVATPAPAGPTAADLDGVNASLRPSAPAQPSGEIVNYGSDTIFDDHESRAGRYLQQSRQAVANPAGDDERQRVLGQIHALLEPMALEQLNEVLETFESFAD